MAQLCSTRYWHVQEIKYYEHQSHMEQYSILGRIGEGAHGVVLKAKHIEVISFCI